jgi:hypothetical protein
MGLSFPPSTPILSVYAGLRGVLCKLSRGGSKNASLSP